MKKCWTVLIALLFIAVLSGRASADNAQVLKEIQSLELLSLSLVGASTSRPYVEDTPLENTSKSKYDNVFSTPFVGGQLTFSPKFGELEGNYRLYGWYAGYDHSKLEPRRRLRQRRRLRRHGARRVQFLTLNFQRLTLN
jgi:hypothetical protein